jgi:hypothetical protein
MEQFDKMFDQLVQQMGWQGTAEELFQAIKGPFNEDVCKWLYGIGNSAAQQPGALPPNDEKRRVDKFLTEQWAEMQKKYPEKLSQIDKAKIQRYAYECYLAGYTGEPLTGDDDSTWMWWLLGLAGLGVAGYYLTKGK